MIYHNTDPSICGLPPNTWAVDTETTPFDEPIYWPSSGPRKTRISPHLTGMRLVLGSVAGHGKVYVFHKERLCDWIETSLKSDKHLIFHNCSFDIHVLLEYRPSLKPLFIKAIRAKRIHDTLLLEKLIRIAKGATQEQLQGKATLKHLALRYAGMELNKDERRVTFDQFENHKDVPPAYLTYAAEDAIATYKVYDAQFKKAELLSRPKHCQYPDLPDARQRFGLLAERNQVMGDVALFWLQRHPVRVDLDAVRSMKVSMEAEQTKLEAALCSYTERMTVKRKRKAGDVLVEVDCPWAKVGPQTGRFTLKNKVIRHVLKQWADERGIIPDLTDTEEVTLERDFWSEHIPRANVEHIDRPEILSETTERLSIWARYTRLRLLRTRYLEPLGASDKHYPNYYTIGARTTRTSASRFPIQQTPKRRDGIRGLIVPGSGRKFVEADWKAAELTGLAQVYHLKYGGSQLGDAINAGEDPHAETRDRIFGEARSRGELAPLRQAAKAVNFGLPGGMGAAKFSKFARGYGLSLSLGDAKDLRQKALLADGNLASYLDDRTSSDARVRLAATNLGLSLVDLVTRLRAWRDREANKVHWFAASKRLYQWSRDPENSEFDIPLPSRPGFDPKWDLWRSDSRSPSGIVRGRASYTEAHNFPFQSVIGCAGKIALFNLWENHDSSSGWDPVAFVHDSILLEVDDRGSTISRASTLLERAMQEALGEVCPDISGGVEVEPPKDRWGPNTTAFGQPIEEQERVTG